MNINLWNHVNNFRKCHKYFDATVPNGKLNLEIEIKVADLYQSIGELIENGNLK